MKKKLLITADGSTTFYFEEWNEHYHSKHGAIKEAEHVFIKAGLEHVLLSKNQAEIEILEMGFGTGLNALLTYLYSKKNPNCKFAYTGVEAYPISEAELKHINFAQQLEIDPNYFLKLHEGEWNKEASISSNFKLLKRNCFFDTICDKEKFDLVYYDAFGARVQPELWTETMFSSMYKALKKDGVLVTYSAKGSVRRAMETVGFTVERLPGPPGKREMLRAIK